MTRHSVWYYKGIAHLSDNDKRTHCGKQISRHSGWSQDESATAREFIDNVNRRCSSCRQSAQLIDVMEGTP